MPLSSSDQRQMGVEIESYQQKRTGKGPKGKVTSRGVPNRPTGEKKRPDKIYQSKNKK